MKLAITSRKVSNVFHVEINLADRDGFTPVEIEAVANGGEPLIECGGDIVVEGEGAIEFTLPTDERYFPSQFPVKQKFSADDFEDAYERSAAWKSVVKQRIQLGIATKRAATVYPSGTDIEDINTMPP